MFKKIIITIFFSSLCGGIIFASAPKQKTNFELWNKTANNIEVKIKFKTKTGGPFHVEPDRRVSLNLSEVNITQGMLITINKTEEYIIHPCQEGRRCHTKVYLSYDHTGLRPQKGKWHGLYGTTMSGLDIRGNIDVKIDRIQQILQN